MSGHTPGPWHTKGIRSVVADRLHLCANGEEMLLKDCIVCLVDNADGKREANACIIAAAPILLEALKEIIARWDGGDALTDKMFHAIEAARAAIALATKESK